MGSLSATELWLVRHGRTKWAATGRHTGWTDIPLDEIGRVQAAALVEPLAARKFDQVFSSPLSRAYDTCALAGFEARAVVDENLREWNYGDYEGRTKVEIVAERPGWNLWSDGVPGGEALDAVATHADRFVAPLRSPSGRVLIFAHGHLLRILTARWLGLDPSAARLFVLEPAATGVLGYERDQAVIRTWNRVADTAPRSH